MKYYIFDLDGTLADSMGYWYGSFREDERYDHERMQQVRLAMKEKYAAKIKTPATKDNPPRAGRKIYPKI